MVVRSTCPPHSRDDSRRLAFRKTVQRGASEDTLGDVSTVFDETPLALFWSSDCLAVWLSGQATSILTFDAAAVDWDGPGCCRQPKWIRGWIIYRRQSGEHLCVRSEGLLPGGLLALDNGLTSIISGRLRPSDKTRRSKPDRRKSSAGDTRGAPLCRFRKSPGLDCLRSAACRPGNPVPA
jgi:hypothetical protein